MRRPPRRIDLLDPQILIPRLATLTVVVGLFCLLLARHLSAPVVRPRRARRGSAAGDLSARVGPPVARRRDEIGDLARDFDGMAERLERPSAPQRRLLRDVSHELRSPLARLEVALELARQRSGDEVADAPRSHRPRVRAGSTSWWSGCCPWQRIESGGRIRPAPTRRSRSPLENVVGDARFEAEGRACDVRLEVSQRPTVAGHPELLHSAVENVVRNAIAFAEPSLGVDTWIGEQALAGRIVAVIRVRDYGKGVPEDQLDRLFEPFHRVEDARDRRTGGVGLGLAITGRAPRADGGEVEARNHPDGGLEVTIRLPIGDSGG